VAEELTGHGPARMLRPRDEAVGRRRAVATALVRMSRQTLELIRHGGIAAGNVVEVARVAGIQAAKQTPGILPLCSSTRIDAVALEFQPHADGVLIRATVEATDRRGVQTEAMAAASIAALSLFDMCRLVDPDIRITDMRIETAPDANRPQAKQANSIASPELPRNEQTAQPQAPPQPSSTADAIRTANWPGRNPGAPVRLRRASQRRGHLKQQRSKFRRGTG